MLMYASRAHRGLLRLPCRHTRAAHAQAEAEALPHTHKGGSLIGAAGEVARSGFVKLGITFGGVVTFVEFVSETREQYSSYDRLCASISTKNNAGRKHFVEGRYMLSTAYAESALTDALALQKRATQSSWSNWMAKFIYEWWHTARVEPDYVVAHLQYHTGSMYVVRGLFAEAEKFLHKAFMAWSASTYSGGENTPLQKAEVNRTALRKADACAMKSPGTQHVLRAFREYTELLSDMESQGKGSAVASTFTHIRVRNNLAISLFAYGLEDEAITYMKEVCIDVDKRISAAQYGIDRMEHAPPDSIQALMDSAENDTEDYQWIVDAFSDDVVDVLFHVNVKQRHAAHKRESVERFKLLWRKLMTAHLNVLEFYCSKSTKSKDDVHSVTSKLSTVVNTPQLCAAYRVVDRSWLESEGCVRVLSTLGAALSYLIQASVLDARTRRRAEEVADNCFALASTKAMDFSVFVADGTRARYLLEHAKHLEAVKKDTAAAKNKANTLVAVLTKSTCTPIDVRRLAQARAIGGMPDEAKNLLRNELLLLVGVHPLEPILERRAGYRPPRGKVVNATGYAELVEKTNRVYLWFKDVSDSSTHTRKV